MYYREPRAPTGRDFALLTPAASLVRLALSQHRKEEAERVAQLRERATARQLLQAQKMEALGTLAGGIAHDLNNALVPVLGMAKLLRKRLPAGNQEHAQCELIVQGATRAKELVQQVLAFSRKEEPELMVLDLAAVASEAVSMLRHTVHPSVRLIEAMGPAPKIRATTIGLHQIIVNLVTNAVQAIGESAGSITVSVGMAADGTDAELVVADTGPGMDEATRARIFEPFFTTKAVGKGTGLGLSVVHGIITSFGGSVEVKSALGHGTCFAIRFPPANE
jgi:signal transduction histidine kinase